MSAAFSGAVLLVLCWILRILRANSARQREEAEVLAGELLRVSGLSDDPSNADAVRKSITPRLKRYAMFLKTMERRGNHFVTWATRGTVYFLLKKLPRPLSLDSIEEAFQAFSDWRERRYGTPFPTETWRAFRQLLSKQKRV